MNRTPADVAFEQKDRKCRAIAWAHDEMTKRGDSRARKYYGTIQNAADLDNENRWRTRDAVAWAHEEMAKLGDRRAYPGVTFNPADAANVDAEERYRERTAIDWMLEQQSIQKNRPVQPPQEIVLEPTELDRLVALAAIDAPSAAGLQEALNLIVELSTTYRLAIASDKFVDAALNIAGKCKSGCHRQLVVEAFKSLLLALHAQPGQMNPAIVRLREKVVAALSAQSEVA